MSSIVNKNLRKALKHMRLGDVKEAEAIYMQILAVFPKNKKAVQGYQKLKAGIDQKKILNSGPPNNQLQELIKLFNANRWEDVLRKVSHLIALFPKSTSLFNLQGASYASLKKYDCAIKSYDEAIKIDPFYADAYLNKGSALQEHGELDAAIACFNKTLVINPQHPFAFFNMGNAQSEKGELDLALRSYKNALKIQPKNAEIFFNIGNTFKKLGEFDEALDCYRKALTIKSDHADVHLNMGIILENKHNFDGAVESYDKAIKINPEYAEACSNMGTAYNKKGDFDAAIRSFQQAIKINPNYAPAYHNMGKVHEIKGELEDAIKYYNQAIKVKPNYVMAISDLSYMINFNGLLDSQERFSLVCKHMHGLEAPLALKKYHFENLRDPDKNLHVGFVSGDFRTHPIAAYCVQLFALLSKFPKLVLHAYYNYDTEDALTIEIKKYFSKWTTVTFISDQILAQKIVADEIDILIDLSNHTAGNRLGTFAIKPAPIQVTSLGLPYTTGLKAMDYYFGAASEGWEKNYFTECFLEMPTTTAYHPLFDPPDLNDLPALKNGYLTYGSCNTVSRINRDCINLWSKLIRETPNSRFVFAGQTNEFLENKFKQWLTEENVDLSRIDFLSRKSTNEYMSIYHQIDIHLTLRPLAGMTTIADALYMGVPSLGLSSIEDEAGAEILNSLGLEDFFLKNEEDFIYKGLSISEDLTSLANIRANLRNNFKRSLFCNPKVAAEGWEAALRVIWKRWCANLDPEPIKITL
ncbi:tetratricopeptide repeat protein [Paracoccaceae bacterium]|nr:tetratricopeptide repeat protein [Paracoccaceae bacterium]